jgi:hypothetical protein
MDVVTAKTIARRDNCKSVLEWMKKAAARRGALVSLSSVDESAPVKARIDFGRWIADCECNGAEYVDPDEPVFLCLSCLNQAHGGRLRRVIFPPEEIRKRIEERLKPENHHSWNEQEEPVSEIEKELERELGRGESHAV